MLSFSGSYPRAVAVAKCNAACITPVTTAWKPRCKSSGNDVDGSISGEVAGKGQWSQQFPAVDHASASPQSQQPPRPEERWKYTSWPSWSLFLKHASHWTHVGSLAQVRQVHTISPFLNTTPQTVRGWLLGSLYNFSVSNDGQHANPASRLGRLAIGACWKMKNWRKEGCEERHWLDYFTCAYELEVVRMGVRVYVRLCIPAPSALLSLPIGLAVCSRARPLPFRLRLDLCFLGQTKSPFHPNCS